MPLEDSTYASCLSPWLFYQLSACGLATAASNVQPFAQAIRTGEDGLWVNNAPENWLHALLLLCAQPELRRLLALRALRKSRNASSPAVTLAKWKELFYGLPKASKTLKAEAAKQIR